MSEEPVFEHDPDSAYRRAEEVKQRYQAEILAKANVVGIGVGYRSRKRALTEEVAIIVLVTQKQPRTELAAEDIVPSEIENVPVDVQEVGDISPHG
ncbi:MAG: hypothetical protein E4G99_06865 [Anaerolineales bacterium]|nr:MAG: hypothetical protein E4G99_06865 [Anaerolineales bacterium]